MNTVVDRDEGRCVVFLQNSQGRGIGGILAQSLIRFGMQAWAADLHDDPEELYELSVKNRANVWFGEAITIYRATRILAEKHDLSKLGMQCIFITMTNLPQSMIDYLAETMAVPCFNALWAHRVRLGACRRLRCLQRVSL